MSTNLKNSRNPADTSVLREIRYTADNQPFHLYQLDFIVYLNVQTKNVYNMGEFKFKFRTIAWPYEIYM